MHQVWSLDQSKRQTWCPRYEGLLWKYMGPSYNMMLCCITSCPTLHVPWRSSPSSCCLQGIFFSCAESLPRLVQQPLSPWWGQPETFPTVQAPVEQLLLHFWLCLPLSWTRGHEDMEIKFPASPPWDPKTRPFGKLSRESSSIGL